MVVTGSSDGSGNTCWACQKHAYIYHSWVDDRARYEDWLRLRCQLLWCNERRPSIARSAHPALRQAPLSAWLVLRGWASARGDGWQLSAVPGTWLIMPPGAREQRFHAECRLLSVACEAQWPDGTHWLATGLPVTLSAAEHPRLEQLARPMLRLSRQILGDDWYLPAYELSAGDFLQLQAGFHRWLQALRAALAAHGVLSNDRGGVDPRMQHYLRRLEHLPVDHPPDWARLAREQGLSAVHADRLFRQAYGSSAAAAWQRRRLAIAQRHLSMPGCQIKAVAADLGFANPAAFSRWFKQRSGLSPRAWQHDHASRAFAVGLAAARAVASPTGPERDRAAGGAELSAFTGALRAR